MKTWVGFLLLVSLSVSEAVAYSPPPAFILSRALKDRKGLRSIEWSARITDTKSQLAFKEHLRVEFPSGRVFATYSGPSDEPWGSHEADPSTLSRLGRFWITVGLDPNGVRVRAALSELGVLPEETTESKLIRIGKSVAWSWGEQTRVLFGKDTFLPMGYFSRSDSGPESVQIDNFMLSGNQLQIPKSVGVTAGASGYRFEIRSVKVDVPNKAAPVPQGKTEIASVKGWVALVR
jgi:hypothetical protein